MSRLSTFVVVVKPVRGASREDVKSFIADALNCYGGSLHPEDPCFDGIDFSIADVRFDRSFDRKVTE